VLYTGLLRKREGHIFAQLVHDHEQGLQHMYSSDKVQFSFFVRFCFEVFKIK
jgi:hypothetical protein